MTGSTCVSKDEATEPENALNKASDFLALFARTWLGFRLSSRLYEAAFRKLVLMLLLTSGVVRIV